MICLKGLYSLMDEVSFFMEMRAVWCSGIKRKKLSKGVPFDSSSNTCSLYTKQHNNPRTHVLKTCAKVPINFPKKQGVKIH